MENVVFDKLNDHQKEAVLSTEGRVRVIAGAGSGKTRVLAHRFVYLVNELGISPSNILCMTFTNKAAQEMKNRISRMVDIGNVNDLICTIHGFCVKVLRRDIYRMGYPKNFIILDEEDCKALAKQATQEFNEDYTIKTIKGFLSEVLRAKTDPLFPWALKPYIETIVLPTINKLNPSNIDSIARYIQLQVNSFALDFTDIVEFAKYLLTTYKDVREYWQNTLNYIMVDEVQDCNASDWAIMTILSEKHRNLFIVGDPDQAIYEWRGSRPKDFIDFCSDKDITLSENYRSTPNILNVANSIISKNHNRIKKDLFTKISPSKVAIHFHAKNEEMESEWVAKQIISMKEEGCHFSVFAILYRASFLSRNIEQAFIDNKIKYEVWGGIRFFERMEIKDILAYLRLIVYMDDLSLKRVINKPSRKFGPKSFQELEKLAAQKGTSLYETLLSNQVSAFFDKKPIRGFINLIEECKVFKEYSSISELLEYILKESGLWNLYRTDGDEDRLENIRELISSVKHYEEANAEEETISLETYLQDIALYTNADYKNGKGDTVKLMTVHQAKGLEFPYVFVVGLNEGIFPSHRTIRERRKEGEEEERRLMYVAVTRAEKALFLTESEGYDNSLQSNKFPSRFLKEIGDGLIEVKGDFNPYLYVSTEMLAQRVDSYDRRKICLQFEIGEQVRHKVFGEGVVIEKQGNSGDEYLVYVVDFAGRIKYLKSSFLEKCYGTHDE